MIEAVCNRCSGPLVTNDFEETQCQQCGKYHHVVPLQWHEMTKEQQAAWMDRMAYSSRIQEDLNKGEAGRYGNV